MSGSEDGRLVGWDAISTTKLLDEQVSDNEAVVACVHSIDDKVACTDTD